ncbi:MAG: integrase arm-type DNA-binding domain-containing protein [bacterium]|nr:integrase arm-type DNA-binding domain-containing protein [bacterium]
MKPPKKGQADYFDAKPPNLGLRVSSHGPKSRFIMYRTAGRLHRLTLGRYPDLSLADARQKASAARHVVADGGDPVEAKQQLKPAPTVADMVDQYIERYAKINKRSWRTDVQVFKRDVLPYWGSRKAQDISRRDAVALLDRIVERGAPITATCVRQTMGLECLNC